MRHLFVSILANGLGLWLSFTFIEQFEWTGTYWELLIAAAIFALINSLVRPVVKLLFGPVILLTLGLFIIAINMGMLWLLDFLTPSLVILDLTALFLGTLVIGLVNLILSPIKTHHED